MLRILRSIGKINRENPKLCSMLLAIIVLWIDFNTGTEIQFPLIYVVPVAMAAWQRQRILSYVMAMALPILRIGYDFPWHTKASLSIAAVNALVEISSMILYAYLAGRTAAQTGRLKKTVTTREVELEHLRAFARRTSATLQGRGLSPGMVEGVALICLPSDSELTAPATPIEEHDVANEIRRLDNALATAISEVDVMQRQFAGDLAPAECALLDVHVAMLNDVGFWNKCKRRVREDLINVEHVVAEEVRGMAAMLDGLKQGVMRERGADIRDIGRRVLQNVGNSGATTPNRLRSLPPNTILVAKELLPSDILELDYANLAALVTEFNSPASHVAILARARNIPAISDIEDATSLLATGDRLLVDAGQGTVTVAPNTSQTHLFSELRSRHAPQEPSAKKEACPVLESVTKDGVSIGLHANISRTDEARLILEYRMDGVGLFRSEFLFLDAEEPPGLDAQAAAYSAVAKALHPRPVVIRTADFGGDKIPRFMRARNDLALRAGKRGLAYSLAEKTMFRTQLRAILRAAQESDVRIMFPMVMSAAEMKEALQRVDEAVDADRLARRPPLGAMIETPSAVFDIQEIAKIADFLSIGTNDLSHFILATDRQSRGADGVLAFLHPCVLRATEQVVRAALKQGVGLTVCGEAAGNPAAACLLVGMGVRSLSLNPFQAASIRRVLRQLTLEDAECAVRAALDASSPAAVQEIVSSALSETTM
ncbi:MAG: phosphoenolpyruvate--protein phosphotransferase [bacterium]